MQPGSIHQTQLPQFSALCQGSRQDWSILAPQHKRRSCLCQTHLLEATPGACRALGMGLHHLKYFTWGMLAIKWLWRPPCEQDWRSPSTRCEAEAFAAAAGAGPSLPAPRGSSAAPSVSLQGSAGCEALRQC